ncbi:MAG TPA: MFS transporter, partial [Candidatus Lokiarchaeia archaeon]|nr:MFS transporter [Candidatus Lokiarchaeia archaeon]
MSSNLPFWPLAIMMAIAMGVQGMYYSYISLAIFFDFTGSTLFTVSILETVPFLANFIVIFWIGKQVDKKRNHKAWFLISLAALSIGNVGFLLIYEFFPNPWVFILTLFPVSVLFGMTFTNGPAYVSFIRPEEKGRFMGFLVMYQSIGSFIGSAAG